MFEGGSDSSDSSSTDNAPEAPPPPSHDSDASWLGSSDSSDDDLIRREQQLQRDQDEFVEGIRADSTSTRVPIVDLSAPAVDYDSVRDRASTIIFTLQNLKTVGDPSLTRSDYHTRLLEDLRLLFGFNEYLLTKLTSLVKTAELLEFLDASDHPRPVVIRANTLRTRRKELERVLNQRGVRLGPVGRWTKLGLVVYDSQVALGSTPEYLAGHYMLQSASSFLPVMALEPRPGTRVLDMCAAPGGKTTHIAQIMKNTGVIIANDINVKRTPALVANLHRLGVVNAIVVNYDGRAFPRAMGGFDAVLLDAPCTGTGVIARDPSVKTSKSAPDVELIVKNQKELILHAYDAVKPSGGRLVYCTCSLLVEENEGVVDYLLKKRPAARVVQPNIDREFDEELAKGIDRYEGLIMHPGVKNARRVYPHRLNMDGFFFAVIDVLQHEVEQGQRTEEKEDPRARKKKKFSKKFGGK
jgi:ribosomal RNA methyltransferase Nop2